MKAAHLFDLTGKAAVVTGAAVKQCQVPLALLEVWFEGLVIAAVLILVARPLAVAPILRLFGFNAREITLVSWVGLPAGTMTQTVRGAGS